MSWHESKVTEAGVLLLNEAITGVELTITGAVGGVGTTGVSELSKLADVANRTQILKIRGVQDDDGHRGIAVQIDNNDLAAGYTLNQIGLYASVGDAEPSLFFVIQDSRGIYIPSKSENPDFLFEMHIALEISNDVIVNIQTSSGVVVSFDEMYKYVAAQIEAHNEDEDGHPWISATISLLQQDALQAQISADEAKTAAINAEETAHRIMSEHLSDQDAHSNIQSRLSSVDARLALIELNVIGNKYLVDFDSLDGLVVTGVWNEALARVEF